ncbi:MAG: hypothetical protein ABEJ57_01380 [Halobacteriaceae archaeon]
MPRSSLAGLVVAVLVVTAGCGGVLDPGADTSDPGTTVPAADLPPGVTADGIATPSRLVDAHVSTLETVGFESRATLNVTFDPADGAPQRRTNTINVTAAQGLSPFLVHANTTAFGATTTTAYWGNTSVALARTERQDRVRYRPFPASLDRNRYLTFGDTLSLLVQLGDYRVTGSETRDGATLVTLRADAVNESFSTGSTGLSAENISDLSSRLVVDSRGVVHSFELSFTATTSEGTATYDLRYTLQTRDAVTVTTPAWIGDALANVTTVDLTAHREGNVIHLEHVDGDPIPAQSVVVVRAGNTTMSASLATSVDPGDTVYAAVNASTDTFEVSTDPIETGSPLAGTVEVAVYSPQGATLFETTLTNTTT